MNRIALMICMLLLAGLALDCGGNEGNIAKPVNRTSGVNSADKGNISELPAGNAPIATNLDNNSSLSNRFDLLRRKRKMGDGNYSGPPPPPPPTRPGPENSRIATSMNNAGMVVETRYFDNNPQISKVEVLWRSLSDKKVTVFLMGGRVVEIPGDKVKSISTVTTATLLELAGVKALEPNNGAKPDRKGQKIRNQ